MFYEKDNKSGNCYKSFAKWDTSYDKEQMIHDLIAKRRIEASAVETEEQKGAREYLWTRMTEIITKEEPIQFYSARMKKLYLPP